MSGWRIKSVSDPDPTPGLLVLFIHLLTLFFDACKIVQADHLEVHRADTSLAATMVLQ